MAYYLTQVAALCGAFKYPEIVTATAMTYLKRFYLRNTCMDYHPKNIMYGLSGRLLSEGGGSGSRSPVQVMGE